MNLKPYGAIARMEAKHVMKNRAAVFIRFFVYGLFLMIYSRLWEVTLSEHASGGIVIRDNIWYLALTELIVLSLPQIDDEIMDDIKSGRIVYQITRPMSYWLFKISGAMGALAVRMGILACGGFVFAWYFAGGLPSANVTGLLAALPLCFIAAVGLLPYVAAIGLLSFWLHDSNPIYWIWHKCLFILGGLILPLTIYPEWLQAWAMNSPFAAFLYQPGSFAFGWSGPKLAAALGAQLLWGALGFFLLAFVYRRATRIINVYGG